MEFDWGAAATAACGLLTGAAVPAAGWALNTINDLRDRVARLEERHQALDSKVTTALVEVKEAVGVLTNRLGEHMQAEASDIERAVERAVSRAFRDDRREDERDHHG